jgi:transposase-like protein
VQAQRDVAATKCFLKRLLHGLHHKPRRINSEVSAAMASTLALVAATDQFRSGSIQTPRLRGS